MLDLLKPFTERLKEYDVSSSNLAAGGDPTHELVEEQSHDVKLPSVAAVAERDTLAKVLRARKVSSVPNLVETIKCSVIIRKPPLVSFVRRPRHHEPNVE